MTDHKCLQLDRLEKLEKRMDRFERIVFGNGSNGMQTDLTETRSDVRHLLKFFWLVAGCVIAELVGVVFLLILKFAGG